MEMEKQESVAQKDNLAAMLIVWDRKNDVQQIKVEGDLSIGNTKWEHTVDVSVESEIMADLHGKIKRVENDFFYLDVSKKKNTFYNGKLMAEMEMFNENGILLHEGDVIRVDEREDDKTSPEAVVFIFHRRYDGKIQWKSAKLDSHEERMYISRFEETPEIDEVQTEAFELPKHYAILEHEGENWFVEDHNTRFGVELNGGKISGRQQLHALDVLGIGSTLFLYKEGEIFYNHRVADKNCLNIHIEERSVWNFFRKHVLLENINLSIQPGEMVLILGGSGAGKTTFVNAVMGYEKAKGTITEGDLDVYRDYDRMKYEIGFVPQQDLLRMEDKVFDTLENAAEMKLPKDTPKEARQKRIDAVLELYGLEREKDSMVSKLSGGQRKRLSIAVEYIADPSLFFLDEPDSGLDGVMARSLMENLRVIADQNKTVLVITHSPDRVADLFDKVIVLAKGNTDNIGHMAFYGSLKEARLFFETDTMEEIVRKINRTDEGGEGMADAFIQKFNEIEGQ